MARPAATDEQRAAQRRRIRRAASDLHREGGLPAVTVRAVAKRAGISTGLLYSYYSNLSDLMRALWIVPIAELGSGLATVEKTEADPIRRIKRLLSTYIEFTKATPETHRGLLLFVRRPGSTTNLRRDPNELMLFGSLRRAIEEGQATGVVRDGDPELIGQMLWSGIHGALALPINIDTYALADGPTVAAEMIESLTQSITKEAPRDPAQ